MNQFSFKKYFFSSIIILIITFSIGCNKTNIPQVVEKDAWTEVGTEIFVITSDSYLANMVMVTSKGEAILVDTGMNEADRQNIEKLLEERNLDLKTIIITHLHDDHVANLENLKTNEMTTITPENSENGQTIELGNKTLKIIFTEGHYQPMGHISVEVLEDNILIAGDIICNNILPPVNYGGDIKSLLTTLKELQEKNYSLIIPGHGKIVETDLIFNRQFEYLNNAKKLIEDIISSDGNLQDVYKIKLTDCIEDPSYLYSDEIERAHRGRLRGIYKQLQTD